MWEPGSNLPVPVKRAERVHVTFGTPMTPMAGEDSRRFATRIEAAVAALADEWRTDWWSARRRAAEKKTPSLAGPTASSWRRAWALESAGRSKSDREWPP